MQLMIDGLRPPTWKELGEHIDRVGPNAFPDAIEEARAAAAYFRSVVVDRWETHSSPFANRLVTGFQGGPPELVRVFRLLRLLGSDPNLGPVITDLVGADEEAFVSALAVLQTAGSFRHCGLEVELLARSLVVPDADYRVWLADRWVTVESTGLHEPEASKQAYRTWTDLHLWGRDNGVSDVGTAHIVCDGSIDELETDLPRIRSAILELVDERAFEEPVPVGEHTTVILEDRLDAWSVLIYGPVHDEYFGTAGKHEMTRLLRAVRAKQRQLTRPGPAVVSVDTRNLYFNQDEAPTSTLGQIAVRVVNELSDLPRTSAAVVTERYMAPEQPEERFEHQLYRAVWGTASDGHVYVTEFIPNPNASIPLTEDEAETWIRSSTIW